MSAVYQLQYVLVILILLCGIYVGTEEVTILINQNWCPPPTLALLWGTWNSCKVKNGTVHFCRCEQQEEPQESESEDARLQGCLCTTGELIWMLAGKEGALLSAKLQVMLGELSN